jgi:outer membrane receptor protein involved in Fe transport
MFTHLTKLIIATLFLVSIATAQSTQISAPVASDTRTLSGVVVSQRGELAPNVSISVRSASGELKTTSDQIGAFTLNVPRGPLVVKLEGSNITPKEVTLQASDSTENLQLTIEYVVPPIHESVVIVASSIEPGIEQRDETVYRNTLFARDDQLLFTLNAGINAGQHEGGGKSLEIRRFGFNTDHGGVNGGLKILVDNVQQNQGTQGHGQGYLGQLKSLTPELVDGVDILNGPFSAQYGDFTGLGVVHIRQKESLHDQLTLRFQGGSFDTFRTFLAYSPELKTAEAFIAYEGSRTDGPFISPLRYKRDNVTGNYTWKIDQENTFSLKLNLGRNDFFSSGQIPLDEVVAGRLDRFGAIDPFNGGRVRSGTIAAYYKREMSSGSIFKVDGFLTRSLFDLYSNFTFYLNDPVNGDEIQQHDSRLQEGFNAQYLRPFTLFGGRALFMTGMNVLAYQTNVGLFRTVERRPFEVTTQAHASVPNVGGYVQQGIDFFEGKLHLEGGLRYDYFHFNVDDKVVPSLSGTESAARFQPKFNLAFTPTQRFPMTVYVNYGRGIGSQDARGVVQQPDGPKVSTTDFYQVGTSHNLKRFSVTTDLFLIDQSNQQVYIPDDGSIEFLGPSRAYGGEVKTSVQLTRKVSLDGGITQVFNAFFRGTAPRVYVDSAPRTVANASLTMSEYRGFAGSLRYRHVSSYRLDGVDPNLRAAGHDLVDFYLTKRIKRWVDFNLGVDNLTNKRYFETQNFFESRVRPADPAAERIHATPGYPFGITFGLTFHFFEK